ncbi:MAG: cytochrome c [Hyphomicrobium sp.]|jgi:mono/diheme cytochrome c family protein
MANGARFIPILAFGILILANSPLRADKDTVEKGRALLQANCARCHAIGAEGESTHKEAPPFRVVVSRYPPDNLAEALAEGLISGHPDMPEFVFEPDEVEAITTYLSSLAPQSK